MKVSICVPTYELGGRGCAMLTILFMSVDAQTFKDFEVVVSDHSQDDEIKKLCDQWSDKFNIRYIKNDRSRGSCEANLNNAIRHANGEFIKPLLQDDFFYTTDALEKLVGAVSPFHKWVVGGCCHCSEDDSLNVFRPHTPFWVYNDGLALGNNKVGSPSVTLYPRDIKNIYFDENLLWRMDCELYYRIGQEIGPPALVRDSLHVIRMRHDSISDTQVTDAFRDEEYRYIVDKLGPFERPLTDFPIMSERAERLKLDQPSRDK